MATVDQLIQDAQKRMDASVEHTRTEFNTVRTGRASAALLDRLTHKATILEFVGISYRFRQQLQHQEQPVVEISESKEEATREV